MTTEIEGGGGEEIRQTICNSSDFDYEYACTVCIQKNGVYSKSESYCPECDVFYCKPCLQYICDHGSLGKAKIDKWGKPTCKKTGQPCRDHTGNLIQLYCGDDNKLCCHVCIAEKHQLCTQMVHIPSMVSKQETRQHLETMQQDIGEIKSKLIEAKKERVEKKKNLQTTYSRLKAEIQEFRRKMSKFLEEMEKQSIDELNELERTINNQLNVVSRDSDGAQEEIESIEDQLQKSDIDDTDRFIWWKQSSKIMEEANKIVSEAKPTSGSELMQIDFHAEIETCLKSLKSLGKVKKHHQNDRPYTVQSKNSFSIEDQEDKQCCLIVSMCQLSDGTFVISDHSNTCLKRINKSNTIISRCSLPFSPYEVCCISDHEIAVALESNIQFVSVGDNMKTTTVLHLDHRCTGLACRKNELYVTNFGSSVYVYSTSGSLINEYRFDEHLSSSMFTLAFYYRCIRIIPDRNSILVYVTNPHKNVLLTIDTNGKIVSSMKPNEIKCLRGICVDDVGNVFVCGAESNNIIQVDATGRKKVGDILLQSGGINSPRCLCFDRINSRLLVACENSDTIHSLELEQL